MFRHKVTSLAPSDRRGWTPSGCSCESIDPSPSNPSLYSCRSIHTMNRLPSRTSLSNRNLTEAQPAASARPGAIHLRHNRVNGLLTHYTSLPPWISPVAPEQQAWAPSNVYSRWPARTPDRRRRFSARESRQYPGDLGFEEEIQAVWRAWRAWRGNRDGAGAAKPMKNEFWMSNSLGMPLCVLKVSEAEP